MNWNLGVSAKLVEMSLEEIKLKKVEIFDFDFGEFGEIVNGLARWWLGLGLILGLGLGLGLDLTLILVLPELLVLPVLTAKSIDLIIPKASLFLSNSWN